jgi:hypothetical protein
MGRRRDMLWHPVKPFSWHTEMREGLRDIRRRIGVLVRGAAERLGLPLPDILQPGALEAADRARAARREAAARAVPPQGAEGRRG